eukprot:582903_1
MSGNYQRQEGQFKNDHPIWTSPGWPNVREDMHIFLHDAGGQDDWYWAVTTDSTLAIDSRIKFRCAVGGAAALTPTACPKWNVTADAGVSYKYLPSLNLSDGLCPVSGQQLCVDSSQYHLAGLRGTFTLTIPHEPLWMRDLNQCDYKAGWVRYVDDGFYGKGYFMLYEPLNDWIIALCVIPRSESENGTFATAKWRPDLCNEWLSRNDQDLRYSAQHRSYDPTFNVSIGACSAQRAAVHGAPCVESDPPDAICLANNSIFQSSFMGTFERLNETGKTFDSPVYRRTAYDDGLNRNGSASFYIWYYIEAYAAIYGVTDRLSTRNWILSHYSLSEAISANTLTTLYTYGRCEGWAYGNPMACQGWVFYGNGDLHYDEQMTTTEGECTANPVVTVPDEWPQYICVGFVNASLPYADELSKVHKDQLIGAFVLNTGDVTESNPVPYWTKTYNDYNPLGFMKLWLGDGLWAISEYSPDKKSFMWCDSGNSANPIDCRTWYDYELEVLDNIYLYECTADDILTASPTSDPTPSPVPNICVTRDGLMSSLLEGIFVADAVVDDEYNTLQFVSNSSYLSPQSAIYMWYHEHRWWLSPIDYARSDSDTVADLMVYGSCRGGEIDVFPVCESCWQMNWELAPMDSALETIEDCSFVVSDVLDGCRRYDDMYKGDMEMWDSVCISKVDEKRKEHTEDDWYLKLKELPEPSVDIKDNLGEYEFYEDTSLSVYYISDKYEVYVAHDLITNRWLVVHDPVALRHGKPFAIGTLWMMCYNGDGIWGTWDAFGPCYVFDSEIQQSIPVDNILSIGPNCRRSSSLKGNKNAGAVVGTVIGIVLGICACFVLIYVIYRCKKDKPQKYISAETEMETTKADNVTKSIKQETAEKGGDGYDMTALTEEQDADDNDNDTQN